MEELQLALTSARVEQRNFGLWINNWQIGQTLNALVTNQLPTGELVLRVSGQQITATADIPVQQGSNLLLEVKQLQPVPTLRVINPAATPSSSTPAVSGTLQLLPAAGTNLASQPLTMVAQTIQSVVQSGALGASVAASVAAPLEQLMRQINAPQQLSNAAGLADSIKGSGTFFEAALRAGGETGAQTQGTTSSQTQLSMPSTDFKAGLFRALGGVEGALAKVEALGLNAASVEALLELKRELEAGLGRVTVHQLNSQNAESPVRQWQLEMPVQIAQEFHSIRMLIERESAGSSADSEDDEHWQVSLQLAPPALGEVELALRLIGEQLELRTSAARADVRALLDQTQGELTRALASRGIRLQATPASSIAADSASNTELTDSSAVDLRA